MLAEELQLATAMRRLERFEEAAAEQSRQHPHRQEEAGPAGDPACAVRRQAAAGNDAVHVGMVRERRSPGVQDQGHADVRPQMFRVGREGALGLGGDLEQQGIDHRLVGVGDGTDRRRQGEHHMEIVHRQQIGLTGFEPTPCSTGLALRAMPVSAGVVGDLAIPAGVAVEHMPTQRRAAALLDGRHDLELAQAQVVMLSLPPGRTQGTEDVRDLQGGTPHDRGLR